jgi:spore germination protein GerM
VQIEEKQMYNRAIGAAWPLSHLWNKKNFNIESNDSNDLIKKSALIVYLFINDNDSYVMEKKRIIKQCQNSQSHDHNIDKLASDFVTFEFEMEANMDSFKTLFVKNLPVKKYVQ